MSLNLENFLHGLGGRQAVDDAWRLILSNFVCMYVYTFILD